ncbi:MAG: sodC [Haloplasmataceae bacterium]|nr:sodC [Haloplasmataceae bacterium]
MINDNVSKMAIAEINGGPLAPEIKGEVLFQEYEKGVMVIANIMGLPNFRPAQQNLPQIGPHGFHIHEFGVCTIGDNQDPFKSAGEHWNPTNQPHGNHVGDFPVLFSNKGLAYMAFFTNKFTIDSIIGKAVIIHSGPDDYKSQPAGNAGKRLACGIITGYDMRYFY